MHAASHSCRLRPSRRQPCARLSAHLPAFTPLRVPVLTCVLTPVCCTRPAGVRGARPALRLQAVGGAALAQDRREVHPHERARPRLCCAAAHVGHPHPVRRLAWGVPQSQTSLRGPWGRLQLRTGLPSIALLAHHAHSVPGRPPNRPSSFCPNLPSLQPRRLPLLLHRDGEEQGPGQQVQPQEHPHRPVRHHR